MSSKNELLDSDDRTKASKHGGKNIEHNGT